MNIFQVTLPIVGAALFRLRGSSIVAKWFHVQNATTIGRLIWSVGIAAASAGAVWHWWPVLTVPLWFAGCVVGWPTGTESLTPPPGQSRIVFYGLITGRGLLWTVPAGAVWFALGFGPWVALAGLACLPALLLGAVIPSRVPGLAQGHELGEFIFGGIIGAALAFSA